MKIPEYKEKMYRKRKCDQCGNRGKKPKAICTFCGTCKSCGLLANQRDLCRFCGNIDVREKRKKRKVIVK